MRFCSRPLFIVLIAVAVLFVGTLTLVAFASQHAVPSEQTVTPRDVRLTTGAVTLLLFPSVALPLFLEP